MSMGGEGVKNHQKLRDLIYGRPLSDQELWISPLNVTRAQSYKTFRRFFRSLAH
jgi:hypothetical protein